MSFENLSVIPNTRRTTRCCSFCKEYGHNIKNCNDNRLVDFEQDCSVHVHNMMSMLDFTLWIKDAYSDNKDLLKSYAVNKGLMKNKYSHTFFECCEKISRYTCEIYKPEFIVDEDGSLESLLLSLTEQFGNQSERIAMPQFEIQDNAGIERIVMREMLSYMVLRNLLNPVEENPVVVKSKINLSFENNENEDIHQLCECTICLNDRMVKDIIELQCEHKVCKECVVKIIETKNDAKPTCPYCRAEITGIKCKTNGVKNELTSFIG